MVEAHHPSNFLARWPCRVPAVSLRGEVWIGSGWRVGMGGIKMMAAAIGADLAARLPRQNKKQREGLALLGAPALDVRDVNLMDLAAALPPCRPAARGRAAGHALPVDQPPARQPAHRHRRGDG